jgi:hypothetical protein
MASSAAFVEPEAVILVPNIAESQRYALPSQASRPQATGPSTSDPVQRFRSSPSPHLRRLRRHPDFLPFLPLPDQPAELGLAVRQRAIASPVHLYFTRCSRLALGVRYGSILNLPLPCPRRARRGPVHLRCSSSRAAANKLQPKSLSVTFPSTRSRSLGGVESEEGTRSQGKKLQRATEEILGCKTRKPLTFAIFFYILNFNLSFDTTNSRAAVDLRQPYA